VKTITRIFLKYLILATLIPAGFCQESNDPVFDAMKNELDRSINRLKIEDMHTPYFLSYRIQDNETATIQARYSSIVNINTNRKRFLYIDLRVGSPDLDNSNFVGSWGDVFNMRKPVVDENDYQSIRHQLWLNTDKAYKKALENLARKEAYLKSHPGKEDIPDFAAVESSVHLDKPASLKTDLPNWESKVRTAAGALKEASALQDWKVTCNVIAANKRYLNSEGSKHLKAVLIHQFVISATVQADDGQRLTGFLKYTTVNEDIPATDDIMLSDIDTMVKELEETASSPAIDEYSGPVLFTDFAAAQFISQLFVKQLSPARGLVTAEDWMQQYLPDGKLARRLNRRVMPEFVTVTDEPGKESYNEINLAGYKIVDDEGVKSETITLVKDGWLVDLPMSRLPCKKIRKSNGHALTVQNQMTIPTVTNLFIKPDKPQPMKKMVKRLQKLAKEFGNEYGLLVKQLDDPSVSNPYMWSDVSQDMPELMTAPLIMYKVYANDGRMELVRGLIPDEVSVRSLRDIVAMGKDEKVFNLMQPTGYSEFGYPIAIITPSILVEEMGFKSVEMRDPLPLSANPMFEGK